MVCRDTLRIKHLPKELSEAQKEDFVRHFGAIKVRVITSKAKEKSVVYAKFENEDIAKNVLFRLHQITILSSRLCVEYAETDILQGKVSLKKIEDLSDITDQKFLRNFINKINAFNDSVGFHQPPPSHLKYNYPKANRSTINNIAHALSTVPRFYTQVLHLMNKMNLPPPFAMPEPPVRTITPSQHPVLTQKLEIVPEKRKESSSESEIESDGESVQNKEIIPQKRFLPQKKSVKRPKFFKTPNVQPTVSKSVEATEKVFEKVEVQPPRKIEVKVTSESLDPKPKQQILPQKEKKVTTTSSQHPIEKSPVIKTSAQKLQLPHELIESVPKTNIQNPMVTSQLSQKKSEIAKGPQVRNPVVAETANQKLHPQQDMPKPLQPKALEKAEENILEKEEQNTARCATERNSDQSERVDSLQEHKQQLQQQSDETRQKFETKQQKNEEKQQIEEQQHDVEQVEPMETDIAPELESPDDEYPCISLEELAANQITDLSVMPIFKKYNPGIPTNKLYIKNCAKTVVLQDLEYIYNRYRIEDTEDKPSEFNIRLMQEGRMKGQAFVTLDSIEMAQKAIKETNGFILKDKPLVVVFGKAGSQKK